MIIAIHPVSIALMSLNVFMFVHNTCLIYFSKHIIKILIFYIY